MRIAFISNVVYPFVKGGAEKRIYEIGTRLVEAGHEVTIYGRHFWDGPTEIEYEGMALRGVSPERELYVDDRRSITEALEFSKDLVRPLRQNIDQHDLLVVSVFPYFPILASKLSTIAKSTPVVTTWHEVWGSYWKEYLGRLAPFGSLVEQIAAKLPQRPVAVSGITADRLATLRSSREKIEVVPNGINIDQINDVPAAEEGFDILFAGRLIADKNVDLLLNSFDTVADHYDCRLGIIGDGPERDRLEKQAQGLHHRDQVTFLGFLEEYEDVLSHMQAADIFASPSTREGFGITFVEAMAADCTVVAARHPESAASEVIGEAGYLMNPKEEALTNTLDTVLAGNRPSTKPTVQAAKYDWDQIAKQAEGVYQDAVDSPV